METLLGTGTRGSGDCLHPTQLANADKSHSYASTRTGTPIHTLNIGVNAGATLISAMGRMLITLGLHEQKKYITFQKR